MDTMMETLTDDTTEYISDFISTMPDVRSIVINIHNNTSLINDSESQFILPVFEGFIAAEILMTALELVITSIAAVKITGWRRNYRNQMLMQLSVARFIKRLFIYVHYLKEKGVIKQSVELEVMLVSSQIYIDYVIAILVCFFIKHMYDSVLIVIVKISRGSFYRVLTYSWVLPIPISIAWTSIIFTGLLDKWLSYIICCIFRWPLMFLSTALYAIILYRVLRDDIRKFARSLTIVTFFLCLIVNSHVLFKDIIELWCLKTFSTVLVSYILSFSLNSLILCLYAILIALNYHCNRKQSNFHMDKSIDKVLE